MKKLLLINLSILLILLLLMEVAVRLLTAPNLPFSERQKASIAYQSSGLGIKLMKPNQIIYTEEEGSVNEAKPKFHINAHGWRYAELSKAKSAEEVRICIIGGSHVFDLNSFDFEGNPSFAQLTENILQKEHPQLRFINTGIPGGTSLEIPNRLQYELAAFQPDYVIFNSIWNDLKWIYGFHSGDQLIQTAPQAMKENPLVKAVNIWDRLLGWSVLYRKLRDAYYRYQLEGHLQSHEDQGTLGRTAKAEAAAEALDISAGLAQYERQVQAFVASCHIIGAKPILAIEERFPAEVMVKEDRAKINYALIGDISHQQLVTLFESCDQVLRKVAEEAHIPLIDISEEMKGRSQFFEDHVHTTPEGSRFLAKEYAAWWSNHLAADTIPQEPHFVD